MKTLVTRSATLTACAALIIAGPAVQASANDNDHSITPNPTTTSSNLPGPSSHNGDTKIIVKGNNNNTAGNDLIIGNNNTSGTGHRIGQPQGQISQATVNVYNCSGSPLTLAPSDLAPNPTTNGEWLSPPATPPRRIPSHPATLDGNQCLAEGVSANWTSATTGSLLTSTAEYHVALSSGVEIIDFNAQAGASVSGSVNATCPNSGGITCDWLLSASGGNGNVFGVVNFIVVPAA
ncbi:hypothetical protein [Streptomyces osmaniensis]|uniref:Uncharacterized protein n=1 Tax=Streptomyces osmaniensis TaxID=593134 RepID=A0ABP6Z8F1_9ACTN